MNPKLQSHGLAWSLAIGAIVFLGATISGCAKTVQEEPSAFGKAMGQTPTVPAPTGFLGSDYSKLQAGQEGQALLTYVAPNVQWRSYTKVLLEPVQFWDGEESEVPASDQQMLAEYFYNKVHEDLEKQNFTFTDDAGAGVVRLQIALVNASSATPGLRSVSVLVPQARILNSLQSLATGSYAFVGGAEAALKATDSQNGQLLAAAMDQRKGGMALSNVAVFKWGDAQNVMDFWAEKIAARMSELRNSGGGAS